MQIPLSRLKYLLNGSILEKSIIHDEDMLSIIKEIYEECKNKVKIYEEEGTERLIDLNIRIPIEKISILVHKFDTELKKLSSTKYKANILNQLYKGLTGIDNTFYLKYYETDVWNLTH